MWLANQCTTNSSRDVSGLRLMRYIIFAPGVCATMSFVPPMPGPSDYTLRIAAPAQRGQPVPFMEHPP